MEVFHHLLFRRQFLEFSELVEFVETDFQRKGIMSKNDPKLRLKFARKVYCKRATYNYEI